MPTPTTPLAPLSQRDGRWWYSRIPASSVAFFAAISLLLGFGSALAEDAEVAPKDQEAPLLAFRAVHPKNQQLAQKVKEGTATCPKGYELLWDYERDENGDLAIGEDGLFIGRPILVRLKAIATGADIAEASPDFDRPGVVKITLTEEGGLAMLRYTNMIVPGRDRMAHVINGKVLSAPASKARLSENASSSAASPEETRVPTNFATNSWLVIKKTNPNNPVSYFNTFIKQHS